MKNGLFLSMLLVFVVASSGIAAPVNMQEGNWEIETSMKIENVPFPIPPTKMTHCYTKKDLEDSSKTRPAAEGSGKKSSCDVKDVKETGSSASWKFVCKDGTSGSGEATYKGTSYSMIMKMNDKGGKGTSTTNIKARRIGDCK